MHIRVDYNHKNCLGKNETRSALIKPHPCALLVNDVQVVYADPMITGSPETLKAAEKICEVAPLFRTAGIPIYIIYHDEHDKGPGFAEGGLYLFQPDPADVLIAKNKLSAFKGSDILTLLKAGKHQTLFTAGFNQDMCKHELEMDGANIGFQMISLGDCSGNGMFIQGKGKTAQKAQERAAAGIITISAEQALMRAKQFDAGLTRHLYVPPNLTF
jgi:nicotinamidase-related amidase